MKSGGSSLSGNICYAALHGFYWTDLCAIISFASVWLGYCGYSAAQIGYVLAAGSVTGFLLQAVLADLADRSRRWNAGVLLILLSVSIVLSSLLSLAVGRRGLLLSAALVISIACIDAGQSFVTSIMFMMEKKGIHVHFGVCRGIGSLMYALVSSLLGVLTDRISARSVPAASMILGALMTGTVFLILRKFTDSRPGDSEEIRKENTGKEERREEKRETGNYLSFFRETPGFFVLILGTVCMFLGHTIINNFLFQIVTNIGGNSRNMGTMAAFQGCLEVPIMALADKLISKFGSSKLLALSFISLTLKVLCTFAARSIPALYLTGLWQFIGYGLFVPCSVAYASRIAAPENRVKAQTCFAMCLTTGTILSSLIGGNLIDGVGVTRTLLIFGIVSAAGTVLGISHIDFSK